MYHLIGGCDGKQPDVCDLFVYREFFMLEFYLAMWYEWKEMWDFYWVSFERSMKGEWTYLIIFQQFLSCILLRLRKPVIFSAYKWNDVYEIKCWVKVKQEEKIHVCVGKKSRWNEHLGGVCAGKGCDHGCLFSYHGARIKGMPMNLPLWSHKRAIPDSIANRGNLVCWAERMHKHTRYGLISGLFPTL